MDKIIKIDVDTENFREIWTEEFYKLIKKLKLNDLPRGEKSFAENYPHINKWFLDTLNAIRDAGRDDANFEDYCTAQIQDFIENSDFYNDFCDNCTITGGEIDDAPTFDAYNDELIEWVNDDRATPLTQEQEKILLDKWSKYFDVWYDENYTDIAQNVYENLPDEMDYYEGLREMEEER